MKSFWVTHVFASATNEEKEEHTTPCDDVETVKNDEKPEWGECEAPGSFEAYDRGFFPVVFRWEFVAVGVHPVRIGTDWLI